MGGHMRKNVYKPAIFLNSREKELLRVLAELLVSQYSAPKGPTNFTSKEVVLSDAEAERLFQLLVQLMSSREFIEKSAFVAYACQEGLFSNNRARQIFINYSRRNGYTKALTNVAWENFVERFNGSGRGPSKLITAEEMSLEHFYAMEKKLFSELVPYSFLITELLIYIRRVESQIEQARHNQLRYSIDLMKSVSVFADCLSSGNRLFSRINLSSVFIVVANTGVLFTTRDWNAAGGLSTIGGALLSIFKPRPNTKN
jgi:hypothetical protein